MFSIAGTGRALPNRSMTLDDLVRQHGATFTEPEKCPRSRHVSGERDSQMTLAATAARRALAGAELTPGDVDMVLHAAAVPYQPIPATSAQLAAILGLADGQAEILDVNATCLSFLSALDIAASAIERGRAHTILIVSSETPSRALPWTDAPQTAALFGDGAAAVVLTPGATRIRGLRLRSYPSAAAACELGAGGTRFDYQNDPDSFAAHSLFRMDGPALYKTTLRHMPRLIDAVLDAAGWRMDDIDTFLAHQASPVGLDHMIRILGLRDGQLLPTIHEVGNLVAASLPYGLATADIKGRLAPGSKILLAGTGAGLTIGAIALEVGS